jgi:hypothetical protein
MKDNGGRRIFLREEHCDFEGAILTAEKDGRKIAGLE